MNGGGHLGGHDRSRHDDDRSARIEGNERTSIRMEPMEEKKCSSSVCGTSITDLEKGMTGCIGLNWAVESGRCRQTNPPPARLPMPTRRTGLELTLTVIVASVET